MVENRIKKLTFSTRRSTRRTRERERGREREREMFRNKKPFCSRRPTVLHHSRKDDNVIKLKMQA